MNDVLDLSHWRRLQEERDFAHEDLRMTYVALGGIVDVLKVRMAGIELTLHETSAEIHASVKKRLDETE